MSDFQVRSDSVDVEPDLERSQRDAFENDGCRRHAHGGADLSSLGEVVDEGTPHRRERRVAQPCDRCVHPANLPAPARSLVMRGAADRDHDRNLGGSEAD